MTASLSVAPQKCLRTGCDFRCSAVIAGVVAVVLLGACQTDGKRPTVSLEEAKQITAEFEGGFVPPPRTIRDVTAILDKERPVNAEAMRKQVTLADSQPPSGVSKREIAAFYTRRAAAARRIGRSGQWLDDLLKSDSYGVYSGERRSVLLSLIGWAHLVVGNFESAVKSMKAAISSDPDDPRRYVNMTSLSAFVGDLEAARQYRDKVFSMPASLSRRWTEHNRAEATV